MFRNPETSESRADGCEVRLQEYAAGVRDVVVIHVIGR